jgi:hypothetical protein
LEYYRTVGIFKALIASYLSNRYQKAVLDNRKTHNSASSEWGITKYGVLQGSIIGPLFFLIYVNDLHNIITNRAKIILYADDTSVIWTNPSPPELETNMNKLFVATNEWFKGSLFALNFKKLTTLYSGQKII